MNRKISTRVTYTGLKLNGFTSVINELQKFMLINGLTHNTFVNYSRKIADISLHFNKLPHEINEQELRDYLSQLIINSKRPSNSEFKHTVYGMRCYFKLLGKPMNVKLPQIKKEKRLPVVLSKEECLRLFELTINLKHRLLLMFIYACGLRIRELCNMKWNQIDVDRMSVFIQRSKGNKDRYVPLSENLLEKLTGYISEGSSSAFVFSGGPYHKQMSPSGIRYLMNKAVKRANINKEGICLHTLRHSYATHLLEDGMDIVSIKELLGHSSFETTLVYLHIVDQVKPKKTSPLDSLLGKIDNVDKSIFKEKLAVHIVKQNRLNSVSKTQYLLFEHED